MIWCRSIIFCAYRRSIGWTEEMREKVVPFSAAGCHHAGFTPPYMKKAACTYMFASVLVRGRGIFNSHFTIFSDSHAARSSHLRYVTCTWHVPPATAIPPLPSSALRAHPTPLFLHPYIALLAMAGCWGFRLLGWEWGWGLPSSAGASQTHPTPPLPPPPQSAVSPLPCRLRAVGKSLGNWVQIEDFNYS